ncbi:hypothetical protein BGZ72_008603 [Mortierella alpina]|nr:hypothetical protein BGZ72_008603 [Mortierella alpina]
MHQDHNIPWTTVASYFAVMDSPRPLYPNAPPDPDFRPLERPHRAQVFNYFTKALIKTIHEFADTERGKYPTKFQTEKTGDVFSNIVIQKCNHYRFYTTPCLNETKQKMEHWISRVKHADGKPVDGIAQTPTYYPEDIDLATVIKILIVENEMLPVLKLASHPSVPLETLYQPRRPNCGWNQLVKYTMQAYVYINILAEFPDYCQGRNYRNLRSYRNVMGKVLKSDEPVELFHHSYLAPLDEDGIWRPEDCRNYSYDAIDIFGDMKRLKEYLKACFAVLYRTEMMARECGKVIPWREMVETALDRFHVTYRFIVTSTENGDLWESVYD